MNQNMRQEVARLRNTPAGRASWQALVHSASLLTAAVLDQPSYAAARQSLAYQARAAEFGQLLEKTLPNCDEAHRRLAATAAAIALFAQVET